MGVEVTGGGPSLTLSWSPSSGFGRLCGAFYSLGPLSFISLFYLSVVGMLEVDGIWREGAGLALRWVVKLLLDISFHGHALSL